MGEKLKRPPENVAADMSAHNKIEQAHHEWIAALDVVDEGVNHQPQPSTMNGTSPQAELLRGSC